MLWSLICVLLVVYGFLRTWMKSRMVWWDFVIMRGSFYYGRLWHRWSANGPAPFPATGPAILVCNHTCSADPTFILAAVWRGPSFIVAREHFRVHPICHKILVHLDCVPVTRSGQDPGALLAALARLKQGRLVCLYPEGGLSGVARNRLRRPKHGMALLALISQAPIFPIYVRGGPRTDALLQSWVMPSKKAVRIFFGPPIDLSAYYGRPRTRRLIEEVADLIMRRVQDLPKKVR